MPPPGRKAALFQNTTFRAAQRTEIHITLKKHIVLMLKLYIAFGCVAITYSPHPFEQYNNAAENSF
jgi:hypothetical protein